MRQAPVVRRRWLWLALVFGAISCLVLLAQTGGIDGEQLRLCRAALPGVERNGDIEIVSNDTDPVAKHGIFIRYRVTGADGLKRPGHIRCAFAGGRFDPGRLRLEEIATAAGPLPEAEFYFLQRFWLGDADATGEGARRLTGDDGRQPIFSIPVTKSVGYWLQIALNILPLAAHYALLAVAYALVYGLVNRISLAFGEIATIGAYVAVAGTSLLAGGGHGEALVWITVIGLLIAALLHGGLLGWLIGRTVFIPMARAPHRSFLIATIGLAILLSETARLASGSQDRWIQPLLNDTLVIFSGDYQVTMTPMHLLETVGGAAILIALIRMMRQSAFGRAWRAGSDDPLMTSMLGIHLGRVALISFALSGGLATLAGAFSALHYGHASYGAGLMIGLKALAAAVLGGIGSLPGAAIGGIIIGATEVGWSAIFPSDWRDTAILSLLILVLIFKPEGLFGKGGDQPKSGRDIP